MKSTSLTERVKIWDKFANEPVDQHAIKLEFFRRVYQKNPPFRYKVRVTPKNRAKIPPMVRNHYKKPVHLLPSLRDVLRVAVVENQIKQEKQQNSICELCNNDKTECSCNLDVKMEEEKVSLVSGSVQKVRKNENFSVEKERSVNGFLNNECVNGSFYNDPMVLKKEGCDGEFSNFSLIFFRVILCSMKILKNLG